jgi:hypothetical protein
MSVSRSKPIVSISDGFSFPFLYLFLFLVSLLPFAFRVSSFGGFLESFRFINRYRLRRTGRP